MTSEYESDALYITGKLEGLAAALKQLPDKPTQGDVVEYAARLVLQMAQLAQQLEAKFNPPDGQLSFWGPGEGN